MTDTTNISTVPDATIIDPSTPPAGSGVLTASDGSGASAGTISLPSTAQKYASAVILFLSVAVTPLSALLVGPFSWTAVWQYVALLLAAVGSYLIPLLPKGWQGAGKTSVAVAGAVVAALIPVWTGTWDRATILVIVMAVVQAIGTEFGVQIRTDQNTSTTINAA
ncbi:hypothetical protein [Humibacter ginsenosidimutans]|uniref:Uncharacterized protein n=1 Tax=Humibacter ginsenosidimutans TaxID=2599293 RepID=A0A5B8M8L0_9MICO|nr:hypothetical protein [Humibacter ginsenosidimutans]QDZ15770.1 hypothetical protein FPZ11_14270 [Humibacter ginsenosidimutans]